MSFFWGHQSLNDQGTMDQDISRPMIHCSYQGMNIQIYPSYEDRATPRLLIHSDLCKVLG